MPGCSRRASRSAVKKMASGKLGAVLLQFPWSFRRTDENREWLNDVVTEFADYPLVLEVRHSSWNVPAFYEKLGLREAYRNERGVLMTAGSANLFLFGTRQADPPPVGRERARMRERLRDQHRPLLLRNQPGQPGVNRTLERQRRHLR